MANPSEPTSDDFIFIEEILKSATSSNSMDLQVLDSLLLADSADTGNLEDAEKMAIRRKLEYCISRIKEQDRTD